MQVTAEIDLDEIFNNLDTDELCTELITREDWRKQLDHALNIKSIEKFTSDFDGVCEYSMKDVIENYRQGKDISHCLKAIAYDTFGLVL